MLVHTCQLGGHFWKCAGVGTCSELHHRSSCNRRCGKTYPRECLHFIDSCPAPDTEHLAFAWLRNCKAGSPSFSSFGSSWTVPKATQDDEVNTCCTKKYQKMRHPDRYGRWQVNDLWIWCNLLHLTSISMLPNSDWLPFVWDRRSVFQGNIIGVVAKSLRQKDKDTEVFLRGASQNNTVKTNPLNYGFRNRGSHRIWIKY